METPRSCCDSTACECASSSLRSCRSSSTPVPAKLEIPDEFESIERQIKALAGVELTFTLRPDRRGRRSQDSRANLEERFARDYRQEAAGQGIGFRTGPEGHAPAIEPASLPRRIRSNRGKAGPPSPPRSPFRGSGLSWSDKVFTFQGPDPKTPRLLLVGIEARASLEPAESVTAKIRKQEGTGSLTFDAEAGRIVNSRNKQKMEMIITDRGQDIVQSSDNDNDDDARAVTRARSIRPQLHRQTIPCFFTLLKKVLRGIPSSRAATLLFPLASLRASIRRCRS